MNVVLAVFVARHSDEGLQQNVDFLLLGHVFQLVFEVSEGLEEKRKEREKTRREEDNESMRECRTIRNKTSRPSEHESS
jgi:hypothetical protein